MKSPKVFVLTKQRFQELWVQFIGLGLWKRNYPKDKAFHKFTVPCQFFIIQSSDRKAGNFLSGLIDLADILTLYQGLYIILQITGNVTFLCSRRVYHHRYAQKCIYSYMPGNVWPYCCYTGLWRLSASMKVCRKLLDNVYPVNNVHSLWDYLAQRVSQISIK